MKYNVKTTARQKAAIDNILSGEYKTTTKAMMAAGYSRKSAWNAKFILGNRPGVIKYMERMDKKAVNRFGVSLRDKVLEVLMNGLTANNNDLAEHKVRGKFADRFLMILNWNTSKEPQIRHNNFNFFALPGERKDFNNKFQEFMKKNYLIAP